MLTSEIEALEAGTFSLDFSEVSLRRELGGETTEVRGPGYLRQSGASFQLKIFANDRGANKALFIENMSTPAGKLIGSDAFFHLAATDESGRLWQGHDAGSIDPSLVNSWSRLRNRSAHAEAQRFDQDFLNLCGAVRVLWYHLLFLAVGYKGPYLDYASPGWPKREFTGVFHDVGTPE